MNKKSRKERDTERRRFDIFRAAEKIFTEKGYHGATLEEIAKAAGYAVGTIYTYFKNKEDLYHSLLRSNTDELAAQEDAAVANISDPEERLRTRIKTVLHYIEDHHSLLAYHLVQPDGQGDVECMAKEQMQERMNLVTEEIMSIKKKYKVTRTNPMLTAYFLKGGMLGILPLWIADPERMSVDELANDIVDVIVGGIKGAK